MLKKLTTLLMIFSLCVLTLQPGVARAGWTDDLVDKITNRVTNILNTINDAKAAISMGTLIAESTAS